MGLDVPHPIPYRGSKRGPAKRILEFFPPNAQRLIEPFAGSASVSLAALQQHTVSSAVIGDSNRALIALWQAIQTTPNEIADDYASIWRTQFGNERRYYDYIRAQFNQTQRPDYFLFLLTRCMKAAARYNARGKFNQCADLRRKGTHPDTLRRHILRASALLRGRATFHACDYRTLLSDATPDDIVYLDPPDLSAGEKRDLCCGEQVTLDSFVDTLADLNERSLRFIVSYEGRTEAETYGQSLPAGLNLTRIEVDAGGSSQVVWSGHQARTTDSLYLSPALMTALNNGELIAEPPHQLALLEMD